MLRGAELARRTAGGGGWLHAALLLAEIAPDFRGMMPEGVDDLVAAAKKGDYDIALGPFSSYLPPVL